MVAPPEGMLSGKLVELVNPAGRDSMVTAGIVVVPLVTAVIEIENDVLAYAEIVLGLEDKTRVGCIGGTGALDPPPQEASKMAVAIQPASKRR